MNRGAYSQSRAMFSIARASFKTFVKSPSAIVFSIVFPVVFIALFGTQRKTISALDVVIYNHSQDTLLYHLIKSNQVFNDVTDKWNAEELQHLMKKGKIAAQLVIEDNAKISGQPVYQLKMVLPSASMANGKYKLLQDYLRATIDAIDKKAFPENKTMVQMDQPIFIDSRSVKPIDFVLPGQLGFSLIASGVFGVAFSFFFMRKSGVLKRIFTTPIHRSRILLGEAIARISFQMLSALIIILLGYLFFDFTLIHGWLTFIQLMIVCFLALGVFMGIGFLIGNLAKSDQVIPAVTNLVTIPQFLLSGTFFSISFFPDWLQLVAKFLPLTYVNDALREIAFDGKNLWDVRVELMCLLLFGVIFFFLNVRYFRWN